MPNIVLLLCSACACASNRFVVRYGTAANIIVHTPLPLRRRRDDSGRLPASGRADDDDGRTYVRTKRTDVPPRDAQLQRDDIAGDVY